jgi:hypothetical protein
MSFFFAGGQMKFIYLFCVLAISGFAKIYDCFTFWKELDLLEVRLNEFYDHVDYFVLVEATETFKGDPKELYYANNKDRFSKFSDKIIHVVTSLNRSTNSDERKQGVNLEREAFQRNQIMQGLSGCEDDDIIFISDVDEFWRLSNLQFIKDALLQKNKNYNSIVFELKQYRYFLDREDPDLCIAAGVTTFGYLKTISPHFLRFHILAGYLNRQGHPLPLALKDAGWHFTYLGGHQMVKEKVFSFSHPENTHSHWTSDPQMIDNNVLEITRQIKIDETFPLYIQQNVQHFRDIGFVYE